MASSTAGRGEHLSGMISALFNGAAPDTVGDLVDHLKGRGLAAVLALLALPIALPIPMPGISAVFGLPMMIIAAQITVHHKRLWLPGFVRRRQIRTERFQRSGEKIITWLRHLEALCKPRFEILCHPVLQTVYGLISFWLALIVFLPIPFGNVLPSLAIFAFALALLEHDGLAALAGLVLSIAGVIVTGGIFEVIRGAISRFF